MRISLADAIERIEQATAEEWAAHRADVEWQLAQGRYQLARKNAELELFRVVERARASGAMPKLAAVGG